MEEGYFYSAVMIDLAEKVPKPLTQRSFLPRRKSDLKLVRRKKERILKSNLLPRAYPSQEPVKHHTLHTILVC
jgi:hypothetical protein